MPSALRPDLRQEKKAISKGYKAIAGVDESGVGPLAGPVVAAAVILKKFKFTARIDDCKRLTPMARERAYREIIRKSVYNIAVINHDIIDAINIYQASRLAMEKAVIGLVKKPDYLLVDGRAMISLPVAGSSIIRGDRRCVSIACASIIAKVHRDAIMKGLDRLYPQYGFRMHKGYATRLHHRMLDRFGPSPVHRLSFAPVKLCGEKHV